MVVSRQKKDMFKILILIIYLQDMYICNCNGGFKQSLHITCMNEGQTIQWTKEKGQTDKQQSTKHYTEKETLSKTKDELSSSRRVSSSCSTSGTCTTAQT
jgi:hypothetical protein